MVTLTTTQPAAAGTVGAAAVAWARTQIGKPYKLGATGPAAYDCSGLVVAAYKAAGVDLKARSSTALSTTGTGVKMSDLQVGDILWYDGHVALYSGNGKVIESASVSGGGVREVNKYSSFTVARRVTGDGGSGIPIIGGLIDGVNDVLSAPADIARSIASALNPFDDWANNLMGVVIRASFTVLGLGLIGLGVSRVVAKQALPLLKNGTLPS